jgi:hypothetical protein
MSNVTKLHSGCHNLKKLYCDCGHTLEYWLGDDNCAYGICPRCDLDMPQEITVKEKDEWVKH